MDYVGLFKDSVGLFRDCIGLVVGSIGYMGRIYTEGLRIS